MFLWNCEQRNMLQNKKILAKFEDIWEVANHSIFIERIEWNFENSCLKDSTDFDK